MRARAKASRFEATSTPTSAVYSRTEALCLHLSWQYSGSADACMAWRWTTTMAPSMSASMDSSMSS